MSDFLVFALRLKRTAKAVLKAFRLWRKTITKGKKYLNMGQDRTTSEKLVLRVMKSEKITFRVSSMEKQVLINRADSCGLSTSAYCRNLSLGGRPKERFTIEEKEQLKDIARLKRALQNMNNLFKDRKDFELVEENKRLIAKLNVILKNV